MIRNFGDFCAALRKAGFSVGVGGNDEGVYSALDHGWGDQPPGSPIRWFSGDPDIDPWEWRVRVLLACDDIAYAKVFFRKAGYITREWYPYFLAARRGARTFEEGYADGLHSRFAKRIHDAVAENGSLPLHEIKRQIGFRREDKSKFDSALTELQMKLYLTMCGQQQRRSQRGEEYGWYSSVFCTVDHFFGEEVLALASKISPAEAAEKITGRVLSLNPAAQKKKIARFISG